MEHHLEHHAYEDTIPYGTRLDILDLDWPVKPGPIEKLPTELLLSIAEILSRQDLSSLSIVSEQLPNASANSGGFLDWTHICCSTSTSLLDTLFQDVCTTVEEIDLSQGRDLEQLQSAIPVPSLLQFTSLRILKALQDTLLGRDLDEALDGPNRQRLHVTQFLPPSIVELHIWFPTSKILEWLGQLSDARASFPFLTKIGFVCPTADDDDPETFSSYYNSPIFLQLQRAGIESAIRCLGSSAY
ncbi:hypothetical protein K491DRAFT_674878 [Lophiostoma macrostomum CBS 122681]|uniref:F-box domain-containing protein n=1 Tax=Lophiostoma macrostomum CBS 122681 TaxID=1314788 RepID=A0A6A6TP49_9PLEO|nr:hypothetical protein K491DRAFT_674878 [Lophiostoma macrostomum CBS 122681]